jgi:hypothetical protein
MFSLKIPSLTNLSVVEEGLSQALQVVMLSLPRQFLHLDSSIYLLYVSSSRYFFTSRLCDARAIPFMILSSDVSMFEEVVDEF